MPMILSIFRGLITVDFNVELAGPFINIYRANLSEKNHLEFIRKQQFYL